jgi:hypothetical protein
MRSPVQVQASPTISVQGASGRVLAASPPGSAQGEVLLSVVVPGSPRYGARWRGPVPGDKAVDEWSDLPVAVDPHDPKKVEILWDRSPGLVELAAQRLHAFGDQLEARISDGPLDASAYDELLSAIGDPAMRAEVRKQVALALRGTTFTHPDEWGGQRADEDPLDRLKRLGELRSTGAVTEEQFAAEKAKLLQQM